MVHDATKHANKLLHQVTLLQCQHLEERCNQMIDTEIPAEREQAIRNIIKREWIKNKHRAIKNRLKKRNAPLTFIVDKDGSRKAQWEMIDVIVVQQYTLCSSVGQWSIRGTEYPSCGRITFVSYSKR